MNYFAWHDHLAYGDSTVYLSRRHYYAGAMGSFNNFVGALSLIATEA